MVHFSLESKQNKFASLLSPASVTQVHLRVFCFICAYLSSTPAHITAPQGVILMTQPDLPHPSWGCGHLGMGGELGGWRGVKIVTFYSHPSVPSLLSGARECEKRQCDMRSEIYLHTHTHRHVHKYAHTYTHTCMHTSIHALTQHTQR